MDRFCDVLFSVLPRALYGIWGGVALYGLVTYHYVGVFVLWCVGGVCMLVCRVCTSLSCVRHSKDFYVLYMPWTLFFLLSLGIIVCGASLIGFWGACATHDCLAMMILVFCASVNCLPTVRWAYASLFCLLLIVCYVTSFFVGMTALCVSTAIWLGRLYCPRRDVLLGGVAALWAGGILGLPWLVHVGGKMSAWVPQVYSMSVRLLHWQELLVWLQPMFWWGYGLGYSYVLSPSCTFVSLYFPHMIWLQLWLETGFFGVFSVVALSLYGLFTTRPFFPLQAAYSGWLLALLILGMQGDLWSGFLWIGMGISVALWIMQTIARPL